MCMQRCINNKKKQIDNNYTRVLGHVNGVIVVVFVVSYEFSYFLLKFITTFPFCSSFKTIKGQKIYFEKFLCNGCTHTHNMQNICKT